MNSKELAKLFVKCFFQANLEEMDALLSTHFHLKGPLFEFNSKRAYIQSLNGNLVPDKNAEILSVTGDENEAAVFYTYRGNTIGQLFRCRRGKIIETIVVFDTAKTNKTT